MQVTVRLVEGTVVVTRTGVSGRSWGRWRREALGKDSTGSVKVVERDMLGTERV